MSNQKGSSTIVKMIGISVLAITLLVPLLFIWGVQSERMHRRNDATKEIISKWGAEQTIVGPILVVPYRYLDRTWTEENSDNEEKRTEIVQVKTPSVVFLPEDLKIVGDLKPDILYRGIYKAVVYRSELQFTGKFAQPSFGEWKVKPEDVLWDDAKIIFIITDLRGTKETINLKLGGRSLPMTPGISTNYPLISSKEHSDTFTNAVSKSRSMSVLEAKLEGYAFAQDGSTFDMKLTLNGSQSIRFAPIGIQTEVKLRSSWSDPSFQGSFLPMERNISVKGFDARWLISYYGRGYPQQWSSQNNEENALFPSSFQSSLFGVDLVPVIDAYRYVERSLKYGIMFIVFIFTAFFLFEVKSRLRIHPFQYTLIGAALCLFYLALLSLSEIITFGFSYWIGALACTLMITLYSARMLQNIRRALAIAFELAAIYIFLYVTLRLQDYSLLIGTAGLFIGLAIVMYVTRNIDWYARDRGKES